MRKNKLKLAFGGHLVLGLLLRKVRERQIKMQIFKFKWGNLEAIRRRLGIGVSFKRI